MTDFLDLRLLGLLILALTSVGLAVSAFLLFRKRAKQRPTPGVFFESQQGPIYYEIHGHRGPFILCIHGLGCSAYCWRKLIPELSKNYRVVTFDLWGFGMSTKNYSESMTLDKQIVIIDELLEHLHIKRCHLLAHSMGGHIGFWYAINSPNPVEKIVAIAPATHSRLAPQGLSQISWVANWTPWLINRSVIKATLGRVISDRKLLTKDVVEAYYSPYRDPDAHLSFAAAIDMIADERVQQQIHQIRKPVLILWGQKDHVIGRHIIEEIHNQIQNSKVETSPRSNHMPMEDDHEWLIHEILAFLKS